MGVKDLWKILKPTARPVNPESLHDVILGVDVSIWLNQAIKGMRDRHGNEIPNAHLLVLFNRICKLLHYRIKPVFVFDGTAPLLKLQTLTERRKRKQDASSEANSLLGKRAMKLLEVHAIQAVTGREMNVKIPKVHDREKEDDMYKLPSDSATLVDKEMSPSLADEEPEIDSPNSLPEFSRTVSDSIDIESDTFLALPHEMQHDLLLEKKENQKHSYSHPDALPKKPDDFSDFQLSLLKNRSSVTRKLNSVRKSLNAAQSASYGIPEGKECDIEARRMESYEGRHYVLIKGKDIGSSNDDRHDDFLVMDFRNNKQVVSGTQDHVSDDDTTTELQDDDSVSNSQQDKWAESVIPDTTIHVSSFDETDNETALAIIDKGRGPIADVDVVKPAVINELETKSGLEEVSSASSSDESPVRKHTTQLDSMNKQEMDSIANEQYVFKTNMEDIEMDSNNNGQAKRALSSQLESPTEDVSHVHISSDDSDVSFVEVEHTPVIDLTPSKEGNKDVPMGKYMGVATHTVGVAPCPVGVAPCPVGVVEPDYAGAVLEEAKDLLQHPVEVMEEVLVEQVMELDKRTRQQERQSAGVTSVMYQDAQELLRLFGLPFIQSPSEAEAQCAALESLSLTHGTITDDNDVLLFGGQKVYRNMFASNEDMELYTGRDISSLLGLTRDKLIALAYFLGSDYTNGLNGIGCVHAMELLQKYSGEGLDALRKIKERHLEAKLKPGLQMKESKLDKKVRLLDLPNNFPNDAIREAYISPSVDRSTDAFEWGQPDLDLLRQYTLNKFGWKQSHCDSVLLPVIKRINTNQTTITSYTVPGPSVIPPTGLFVKSKRLRNAVARMTGHTSANEESKRGGVRGRGSSRRPRGRGRGRRGKRPTFRNDDEASEEDCDFLPTKRTRISPISSSSSSSECET